MIASAYAHTYVQPSKSSTRSRSIALQLLHGLFQPSRLSSLAARESQTRKDVAISEAVSFGTLFISIVPMGTHTKAVAIYL